MLLTVRNLYKDVIGPDKKTINILNNINLDVAKGDFLAIIGPSGSGKTTLLQILGLMDSPSSGEVFFMNKSINELSTYDKAFYRADKIGFVFQNSLLLTELTLEENIKVAAKIANRQLTRQELDEILNKLGLYEKKKHYPRMLSTGEAQRGSLARALINSPSLVIADEPTANLDKDNKLLLLKILKEINEKEAVTIILASHDELILNYSRKIAKLYNGQLIIS